MSNQYDRRLNSVDWEIAEATKSSQIIANGLCFQSRLSGLRTHHSSYNITIVGNYRPWVGADHVLNWTGRSDNERWWVMTEQATLILKNDVSELARVMNFVSDLCLQNSIPPETEYDLNLALDEMITNVAKHAYPEGGEHHFTVQITVSHEEFAARIEDGGVEFNPTEHPIPDLDAPLEERKEGGLGIYLVRQIMTSVQYQRIAGKNVVTLRKKLT
jgi:anti-sigma regulatory factor (Ser/Thr protein kinase)